MAARVSRSRVSIIVPVGGRIGFQRLCYRAESSERICCPGGSFWRVHAGPGLGPLRVAAGGHQQPEPGHAQPTGPGVHRGVEPVDGRLEVWRLGGDVPYPGGNRRLTLSRWERR